MRNGKREYEEKRETGNEERLVTIYVLHLGTQILCLRKYTGNGNRQWGQEW